MVLEPRNGGSWNLFIFLLESKISIMLIISIFCIILKTSVFVIEWQRACKYRLYVCLELPFCWFYSHPIVEVWFITFRLLRRVYCASICVIICFLKIAERDKSRPYRFHPTRFIAIICLSDTNNFKHTEPRVTRMPVPNRKVTQLMTYIKMSQFLWMTKNPEQ